MNSLSINNTQQITPSFKARLVGDREARKIIQAQLADYFAKAIDTKTCPSLTPYKDLSGKKAYRWLQDTFKKMTKGIGGTFELNGDSTSLAPYKLINVTYKPGKKKDVRLSISQAPLFSHDILPSVIKGPKLSFAETVKIIIEQVMKDLRTDADSTKTAQKLNALLSV